MNLKWLTIWYIVTKTTPKINKGNIKENTFCPFHFSFSINFFMLPVNIISITFASIFTCNWSFIEKNNKNKTKEEMYELEQTAGV